MVARSWPLCVWHRWEHPVLCRHGCRPAALGRAGAARVLPFGAYLSRKSGCYGRIPHPHRVSLGQWGCGEQARGGPVALDAVGSCRLASSSKHQQFQWLGKASCQKGETGSVIPLESAWSHPRPFPLAPFWAGVRVLGQAGMLRSASHPLLRAPLRGGGFSLCCCTFTRLGRNPGIRSRLLASCPAGKFGVPTAYLPCLGERPYF